jgi:hypothetical protein
VTNSAKSKVKTENITRYHVDQFEDGTGTSQSTDGHGACERNVRRQFKVSLSHGFIVTRCPERKLKRAFVRVHSLISTLASSRSSRILSRRAALASLCGFRLREAFTTALRTAVMFLKCLMRCSGGRRVPWIECLVRMQRRHAGCEAPVCLRTLRAKADDSRAL